MTAQLNNVFIFNNQKYAIIAQQNELDFKPEQYDIIPDTSCSMCWRGYYCKFGIFENRLVLMDWNLMVRETISPPIIENTQAHISHGTWQYLSMNFPIDYSGGIVIGTGFIDKYYIHIGYQQVYAYEKVLELIFNNGKLIESIDHSDRISQVRMSILDDFQVLKNDKLDNIPYYFSKRYDEKWDNFK